MGFLSWWLSPKDFLFSCASIPEEPPVQKAMGVPTGQFVPRNETGATLLTSARNGFGPQPIKCQMDTSCGDLAVVVGEPSMPNKLEDDQGIEHAEPLRDFRPELEAHPEKTELDAHVEELKAEGRLEVRD